MNDILEANLSNLERIYKTYHTSVKKFIVYEDVIDAIQKTCPLNVADVDIKLSFGMSKMVVSDEVKDYNKYKVMLFPEWLEFIGRLSDAKFKNSPESN